MAETLASVAVKDFNAVSQSMRTAQDSSSNIHTSGVCLLPVDVGGLSTYSVIATGSADDATVVKASAGQLYGFDIFSIQTAPLYIKFYNKASAVPAVATDTPKLRFGLFEEVTAGSGSSRSEFWPQGIAFGTGIGFVLVTGIGDTDGIDVTASQSVVNIYYK